MSGNQSSCSGLSVRIFRVNTISRKEIKLGADGVSVQAGPFRLWSYFHDRDWLGPGRF